VYLLRAEQYSTMKECVNIILKLLEEGDSKTRKKVLKLADKEIIRVICECALNILNGNVPLDPEKKQTLGKFKSVMRKLAQRGENWKRKKRYLQTGRGLNLIPLLLSPILSGVINSLIQ